jgi:hypothetical protein
MNTKLHPCRKCKLPSERLAILKHMEINSGNLSNLFYVLCGCKEHRMYDSPEEAVDAWNKANAPLES